MLFVCDIESGILVYTCLIGFLFQWGAIEGGSISSSESIPLKSTQYKALRDVVAE